MVSTPAQEALPATEPPPPRRPARRQRFAERPPSARRWHHVSLLWRVFAANTTVLVVAFAVLAWGPVTVHRIATPRELVVLTIGLVLILAADLVLLRRAFAPLRQLAVMMGAVDPAQPGRRAESFGGAGEEVLALAGALNAMLDRLEGERRESGRRILAAQESERKRIARDLHDEVGQTLTAIALRAERAVTDVSSQSEALAEITRTALRSLEDVGRLGRELRPEALDDLGLVNALIALCSRVDRQGGVRVRRELEWDLPALSAEIELVIYRAAQEALTNVLRHAEATEVRVSLSRENTGVILRVRDNGRGLPERTDEGGFGGMRERAMLVDADLKIGSGPHLGTEVALSVSV